MVSVILEDKDKIKELGILNIEQGIRNFKLKNVECSKEHSTFKTLFIYNLAREKSAELAKSAGEITISKNAITTLLPTKITMQKSNTISIK
ncbi:MAG: hypothetical protein ACJAUH_001687 [Saprospiraceae bacterium]